MHVSYIKLEESMKGFPLVWISSHSLVFSASSGSSERVNNKIRIIMSR